MMRTRAVGRLLARSLTVLSALTPALAFAQGAGRVFNPRVSPANPDLIAYETLVGDRQELTVQRVSTKETFSAIKTAAVASGGLVGLPGLSSSTQLSVYSGDADWRPVISENRQWFSYIASERGTLKLFVNYIQNDGDLSGGDPIALPVNGGARQARWSPDGKHLAFVSDSSVMFVFWNLDRALRTNNRAQMVATRIAEPGVGVLFPAWSPRGNYIAYQAERSSRGSKRYQIEVIGVDTLLGSVRGTPVVLTEDLTDANAFRPSWSADAKYVAYYVDRLGSTGEGAASTDIGVVEAQTQPTTGRILRGELLRGQSRRLAEAVFPNAMRGPSWTRMFIGSDAKPAVVYVQLDDAKGNPMFAHSIDAWLSMRSRDESRVALSPILQAVNPREVTATPSNGFLRYAYTSLADGGQVIRTFDDPTAKWASGMAAVSKKAAPVVAVAPKAEAPKAEPPKAEPKPVINVPKGEKSASGGANLGLAVVFPGAGQLAGGSKGRGALYSIAGIAGAGLFAMGFTGTSSAADAGFKAKDRAAYDAAKSDYDGKKSLATIGAGALGVAWAVGIIDAAMHRDGSPSSVSLISTPGSSVTTARASTNVGLRFSFGGSGN